MAHHTSKKKKPRRQAKAERKEATHELVDLEVMKVDLVGNPATGDKFLVMRSEDPAGEHVEPDPEPMEDGAETASEPSEPEERVEIPAIEETDNQEASEDLSVDSDGEESLERDLDSEFKVKAMGVFVEIARRAQKLVHLVEELPASEAGGICGLPEDILEGLSEVGIEVARAVVDVGVEDFDPGQALWNSIQRAGAKMKKTRLQRFKEALDVLGKIMTELEGSEERNMDTNETVKREEETAPETATQETTETQEAATEETTEETTEQVNREETTEETQETTTEKPKEETTERGGPKLEAKVEVPGLDELMKKMDQVVRSNEKTQEDLKAINTRLDKVERSSGTPNGDPEPEDTQEVNRKEQPFWGNVTGMAKE